MRDEGGGVGAPTVRKEKPLILQKAVSLSANLFLEMRFLNPPRVKLPFFWKILFFEVSWSRWRHFKVNIQAGYLRIESNEIEPTKFLIVAPCSWFAGGMINPYHLSSVSCLSQRSYNKLTTIVQYSGFTL